MKYYFLIYIVLVLQSCMPQSNPNGGFEDIDKTNGMPLGWSFQLSETLNAKLDSLIKKEGKYSLSIENSKRNGIPQVIQSAALINEESSLIELRGIMKTEDVNGFAGLWLRLDGKDEMISFNNMQNRQIKGTTDWTEYSIRLTSSKDVKKISYGGILFGTGKAWFDNFRLYINDKPAIGLVLIKPNIAEIDTSFRASSRISDIPMNSNIINNLTIVGQFWGFLKYHHPYISSGDINWDGELFKILAKAINCKNYNELSSTLESYLDSLPKVERCANCSIRSSSKLLLSPDYGNLLSGNTLSKTLMSKLKYIQENRNIKENYWIKADQSGAAKFTNEKGYEEMLFPDAGYRLLCLYRYWAAINYFYPYKDLVQKNWNQVLKEFIPKFILAKNKEEYTTTTLKLITMINDTHGNIWAANPVLEFVKGIYATPFQAKFIEGKLVITGYYKDTLEIKKDTRIGDIIVSINGSSIDKLIKKYLPLTPASNYETQLRDLPMNYLLRSNNKNIHIIINRRGENLNKIIPLIEAKLTYKDLDYINEKGYYLINNKIGYIYAGKYKNSDLPKIKSEFSKTKGIIVDLRCYPSNFMPFTFGNYIKSGKSIFSKFSKPDISLPGLFLLADSVYNGTPEIDSTYKGKIIVIVNSSTQSQAEYTTMALQSSSNVKVIGSQTAGADGDVTRIILPGGIVTMISGIGVFYPNLSQTQRIGVKIDYMIKPTIKGITERKDELLEKAVDLLKH